MIVRPQPSGGVFLDVLDAIEQVMGQPVVSHGSVIPLNIGILLRLARLNEFEVDAATLRPHSKRSTDVFRPILSVL